MLASTLTTHVSVFFITGRSFFGMNESKRSLGSIFRLLTSTPLAKRTRDAPPPSEKRRSRDFEKEGASVKKLTNILSVSNVPNLR